MEKITHQETKDTLLKKSVRLLRGALAATMITGAAYAEEKKDDIQTDSKKFEEKSELPEKAWLSDFDVDSISIGRAKVKSRGLHRQLGLYKNNVHIGDMSSEFINYTKDDFIRDVANILDKNNIKYKLNETSDYMVEVELENNAIKKLEEFKGKGLKYGKTKDKEGNDMLVIQGNEGDDFFNIQIDLKNDHNPNTFVKIDVNEQGHLRIEGNDDKPFEYEIFTDGDQVKIKTVN
jgi:hypothetical protein